MERGHSRLTTLLSTHTPRWGKAGAMYFSHRQQNACTEMITQAHTRHSTTQVFKSQSGHTYCVMVVDFVAQHLHRFCQGLESYMQHLCQIPIIGVKVVGLC